MKRIFALLLVLIMAVSLVACSDKGNTPTRPNQEPTVNENPTVNTNPTETPTEPVEGLKSEPFVVAENTTAVDSTLIVSQKKPDEAALCFLTAIATNQYDIVPQLLNINGCEFVTAHDVEFNVPRGDYSSIVDYAGKTCYVLVRPEDVSRDGDNATVKVALMEDPKKELTTFTLNLVMDANNNWVVVDDNFVVNNFSVVVPGKAKLFINDVEVDKDKYFVENTGEEKMYDLYRINYIGKSLQKIKITGTGFEKELEQVPSDNASDPLEIDVKLQEEDLTAALDALKLLWNNMYTDYINGVPDSELLEKYFDAKADATSASVVTKHFKNMTEKEKDHVMADILPHDDKECYFLTENTVLLNFKYEITYIDGKHETSQRQIGHIWLSTDGETYKIAKITDENMFDPHWINQW